MKNLRLVWLILLTVFFVGNVFAQQQLSECKDYNRADFKTGTVTFNVVKADLQDILNYITEIYSCNFVIDKSVKTEPITVKFEDAPWNIALDSILKSQRLNIQASGSILRVAYKKQLDEEATMIIRSCPTLGEKSPIITEQIKLKYIPTQTSVNIENLLEVLKRRNTNSGNVEFEKDTNTLKVTDVRENVNVIKKLVEIMDVEVNMSEYLEQKKKCEEAAKNNGCIKCSK